MCKNKCEREIELRESQRKKGGKWGFRERSETAEGIDPCYAEIFNGTFKKNSLELEKKRKIAAANLAASESHSPKSIEVRAM